MHLVSRTLTMAAAALTIAATPAAVPMEWNVDNAHTKVGFSVRHFFTPVEGSFNDFSAQLVWDRENPANSRVDATIQVASVDTENADRDAHHGNARNSATARCWRRKPVST
ncbi:MAG: YceI family protein [Anaerolineales bacterium]